MRIGRVVAVLAVMAVLVPSAAGAFSLSTGNGRAELRERPVVLPGEARTEARLVQMRLSKALARGDVATDLGQITAEAAKAGGLFSELVIEGLRLGEESIPTIAYHSDGGDRTQASDRTLVTIKEDNVSSSLALANWHLNSALDTGAVSRLDLLSGTLAVPGVGLKANIGERGFASQVTRDKASARFAITLEDLNVTLDSLLPDVQLPLGTSLDMITRLQLPLGEAAGANVAGLVRLMEDLALIEHTFGDIDEARAALSAGSPAAQSAMAALDAAEAAAAQAAQNLTAAAAQRDAAATAAVAADAAVDAANASVAAAQADVAAATATVDAIQAQIAGLDADIAALEAEQATTLDPVRLLQIPGEIAAKESARADAVTSLSSAQAARTNLAAVLSAVEADAATKQAAAASAQTTLQATQAAVAAATTAVTQTQAALTAAQADVAAALAGDAANNAALAEASQQLARAEERLRTLLQAVSDVLATLPPLPLIEQDLDEALRASEMLSIGGIRLETMVEADANGSRNLVHCTVEDIVILGYRPQVEECTDLIAAEKEAVRRVNEVLQGLGAVGVEGVKFLGPGGTWTEPGPVGPDGVAYSEGQMAALQVSVPEVRLDGIAANALARLAPVLEMLQQRPAARLALPAITPRIPAATMSAMSEPAETKAATLGDQVEQLSGEADQLNAPETLREASTGSVDLVVAQARTVARFDTKFAGLDDDDPSKVCAGDPVCLAKCAAGQCPSAAGDSPAGAGSGAGGGDGAGSGGPGGPGSGSDHVGLATDVTGGGKLPHTGAAGGLTAVALLALSGAGSAWLRRRP